jgi:vancomycin permeability regulator SanA
MPGPAAVLGAMTRGEQPSAGARAKVARWRHRWRLPRRLAQWPRWWPARFGPKTGLLTAFALLAALLGPPVSVTVIEQQHRYRLGDAIPSAPVALVLGAGVTPTGDPSYFLYQRVELAATLYRQGTVRALLMSGDNSRDNYDEVTVMAQVAEDLGVPAGDVVTDHAGFDTYSSCYRARSVWGLSRVVVISQPFHLARAVAVCRALGVDAVGAQTRQINIPLTWRSWFREIPAIHKASLDMLFRRTPTFPGPREHDLDRFGGPD